jgi:hypothetical protein
MSRVPRLVLNGAIGLAGIIALTGQAPVPL